MYYIEYIKLQSFYLFNYFIFALLSKYKFNFLENYKKKISLIFKYYH